MNTLLKTMVVLALVLLWLGGGIPCVKAPVAQAVERTLKYSHVHSPEHSMHKSALLFAKIVNEKTGGRIEIKVFPSEQLGTERQFMEGIKFGSIEMGNVTGNTLEGLEPIAALLILPYLVKDFDHGFRLEDGPIGAEMKARILKNTGMRTLGFNTTGIRSVLTRDKPIRALQDFKGLKIRVPESPIMVSTFRHLGANPTPIPMGELYTALQTKVVDACESPPPILADAKLFEVAKFLTLTNHIYTDQFILINEKVWQSLSEQDRAVFAAAAKENQDLERRMSVQAHTDVLNRIKGQGVTVIPIDNKPLREAVRPMYEEFGKKIGGMALIEQVMKTP